MTMHSAAYTRHINSPEWQAIRAEALAEADYQCQRCGELADWLDGPLEVHHLTYERLGAERPEDLLVVCRACHVIEDKKRVERTASRQWVRRVQGYARKRWGEDWRLDHEWWEAEEALEEWLEELGEDERWAG